MAVDNIFGDEEAQETPAPSKDKSKKHVAPASKVSCFICASPDPSIICWEHQTEQSNTKNKHAKMVSIPYDAIPCMDTNSREFRKAILVESTKVGNPSGKCACTKPPFIGSLADLQSLQSSYFIFLFIFPDTNVFEIYFTKVMLATHSLSTIPCTGRS